MSDERWKLTIRIYTPQEAFHERRSYFRRYENGDVWLQLLVFGFGILFGFSKQPDYVQFFMVVGSDGSK